MGAQKNHLIETVLLCTYNICFGWEIKKIVFQNAFLSGGLLLITCANSLVPDQAQQNIGPNRDQNCLTLWWCFWKNLLKKLIQLTTKNMWNYLACKEWRYSDMVFMVQPRNDWKIVDWDVKNPHKQTMSRLINFIMILYRHYFLSWNYCLLIIFAAFIWSHFRQDFIMEANTELGPYCLQYRLPENICRWESR